MKAVLLLGIFLVFPLFNSPLCAEESDGDAAPKVKPRPSFGSTSRGTARSIYLTPRIVSDTEKRILAAIVWHVNPAEPITKMQISLSQQKVFAYQGEKIAAISPVSTGKPGRDTPPGKYSVVQKKKDQKSNLYGSFVDAKGNVVDYDAEAGQTPPAGTTYVPSPMPNYLRLTFTGIGMHAGYLPGYTASHGCIRMPPSFAEDLFPVVPIGTPVEIIP